MSKNRKIIGVILVLILTTGCQSIYVPYQYQTRPAEIETNTFGSWVELEVEMLNDSFNSIHKVSGELLALQYDSMYVLVRDFDVHCLKTSTLKSAKLSTHQNQAGTYGLMTGLFILPNIIATAAYGYGGFMILAIPTFLMGSTITLMETGEANILKYPRENTLLDFKKYSRFPQGIPKNLDLKKLTLKKE